MCFFRGYSNNFFVSREKLYEIKYYDGYGFINSNWMPGDRATCLQWTSTESLDQYYNASAKGLMTGTITFLLDNQNFKKYTAYYYDYMGRVVQQNSANYFNPY